MPSWTVHSTVSEPPELLAAFVAHYLSLGADRVHLCLDRWDSDTIEMLSCFDRLDLTKCDDAYWISLGRTRPPDHQGRQVANAQAAFDKCRTDWFFFCDADEFLAPSKPISTLLQNVPDAACHIRVPMAERVHPLKLQQKTLFDGAFRKVWHGTPEEVEHVYGSAAPYLVNGLTGHCEGKSFTRVGAQVRLHLHYPIYSRKDQRAKFPEHPKDRGPFMPDVWLAHFDGLTRLHWRMKLIRQAVNRPKAFAAKPIWYRAAFRFLGWQRGLDGPLFRLQSTGRERQISDMSAAQGDILKLGALDLAITTTKEQRHLLRATYGAMADLTIDPAKTLNACNALPSVDLSAQRFNRQLRTLNPELCAQINVPADP